MSKPKKLFWVEMKLSKSGRSNYRRTAGIRGGKRSSLAAAQESKMDILRFDPEATVKIYESDVVWREVG